MRRLDFEYSARRFAWWRVFFGTYLLFYAVRELPYSLDLYSLEGPMHGLYGASMDEHSFFTFPGMMLLSESTSFVYGVALLKVVLAALFLVGFKRRWVSFGLWFVMASLFNKNPTTYSIELPYHGWILLACALIPEGDSVRRDRCSSAWQFPPILYWGAWVIVGLAYTYAGYTKFFTPRWWEGGASAAILQSYHGYNWFRPILVYVPNWLFTLTDRAFLLLEFLAAPGYLLPRIRPWAWLVTGAMHIPILLMMNVPEISFGMLLIHMFIFDEGWMRGRLWAFSAPQTVPK